MDVNVVIAARKGDREAYGKLMAEMRPALMAQARAIVKDDYIADECVSETMMRVFDKLPQLRSAGSFPAWARKICTNVCCNEYRRVHRELSLQSVQEPAVSSCYQLTDMYLRWLCAQDAFIVYQKAVENVSFKVLGEMLQLSPNTVKSRFYRALHQLRREFDPGWTSTGMKNFKKTSQRKRDDKV